MNFLIISLFKYMKYSIIKYNINYFSLMLNMLISMFII